MILEDKLVTFCRIEYPVEETRRTIYAVDELVNMLGDWLLTGR